MKWYIIREVKEKLQSLQSDPIQLIKENQVEINDAICYGSGYKQYPPFPNINSDNIYSRDIANFLLILCENVGIRNCTTENIPIPDGFDPNYILLTVPNEKPVYGSIFYDMISFTLILVWSGTSNLKMMEEDSNVIPVTMTDTNPLEGIKVHRGFLNIYEKIKKESNLLNILNEYFTDYPCEYFIITGNSLGGGLSYISAFDLEKSLQLPPTLIYTFGSPRAGNIQFSNYFRSPKYIVSNMRIFNTEDLVPTMPPPAPKVHYTHIGNSIPFTYNSGSVVGNHIPCYFENLP
jgi:predicted lipase